MSDNNFEELEKEIEKRAREREKKKKPKMRVSGKGVFGLAKIISKKAKKN